MTVNLLSVGRQCAIATLVYFASTTTATTAQRNAGARDDINTWSPGKLRSRGEEAFSLRQFDEALRLYEKATEVEPDNGTNFYKLFRVHNRMRKYTSALSDIEKALELEPSNTDWRMQKAKLLKSLGQCDRSAEEYHQVFGDRHGFLKDLSILDLLFNKGPAAYAFLLQGELREA